MTKHFVIKAGILALLLTCLVSAGRAQTAGGQGAAGAAASNYKMTKGEETDYKAFFDFRNGDAGHEVVLGEAFLTKYPMSPYLFAVYSTLTGAYLKTNNIAKMMDVGTKALALNPDDIDVLPLMSWAIARQVTGKTPDAPAQLQKAAGYGRHAIDLVGSMPKPAGMDDAAFAKAKNQKLALCHSGLGTVDIKTGKYDDAVNELNQSVMLAVVPDLVDYYLLGLANEQTSHFTEAQDSYTKCAANGSPVQAQCKAGLADSKEKAKNSLEAPK